MTKPDLDLIHSYLEGTITEADLALLQSLLRGSAEARESLRDLATVETKLQELAATNEATLDLLGARPLQPPASAGFLAWVGGFFARPLRSAVAGLLFGMLGASAAWAYTTPRVQQMFEESLALANAGFESGVAPGAGGVPTSFGVWSGDYAELVESRDGIAPREGKHMLQFLRSDSELPSSHTTGTNGNIYQVVDMRKWRDAIAEGTASVDWSAWFNSAPEKAAGGMMFKASLWAFAGDTAILPRNWLEKLYTEIAYNSHSTVADTDPQTWQSITGSMFLPRDTDFLVIELKVIPMNPIPHAAFIAFSGQYADDVRLELHSPHSLQPVALNARR